MILRKLFYLSLLRKQCRLPISRLRDIQSERLRKIIRHANDKVPYYKETFKDISLSEIKTIKDLRRFPILNRRTVQERFQDMLADGFNIDKCRLRRTSGSTGSPGVFLFEQSADDFGHALDFRSLTENGYRFTRKMLEITDPRHAGHESIIQKIGLYKLDMASVYAEPKDIMSEINAKKPSYVKGYPSILRVIGSQGSLEPFGLEKVFSTSELLSSQDRSIITRSFGADLIDLYGSVEFPRVAWECEKHEGYHIDMDALGIEIVDQKGEQIEEGKGRLVITSLYNKAMPLIRYEVGDMAEIERDHRCSCGRGLPLLKCIHGRSNDRIILPSGREISPLTLYNSDTIKGVREFKIIQKKKSDFQVLLVKGPDFNPSTYDGFRQSIAKACSGDKVAVRFKAVEEIPRERSGKFRAVISLVSK